MPRNAPSKFKSKDAEWTEDLALYLKDFDLARYVYDAIQIAKNFRLVVDGTVLYSRPTGTATPCSATSPKLWSSKDMEWDSQGCLLDKKLGKLIEDAHASQNPFKIEVPAKAVAKVGPGGGIGEYKVNAMCLC
jgi:hypothetical protein